MKPELRELLSDNKLIYGLTVTVIVSLLLAFIVFFPPNQVGTSETEENVALRPSNGFNIEYLVSIEDGERAVFERYRLFDETGEYEFIGSEGNINISRENAQVFLTHPDGTREEITSDLWYFPLRIIPPLPEGAYTFTFKLKTGEVYSQTINFPGSREVKLMSAGLTRIQEKSEATPDMPLTPEQRLFLADLQYGDRESRVLTAFSLWDLDLTKATSLFHIDPHNTALGGSTLGANADAYFWLDLVKIAEVQSGEHIFLAKIDGVWHYATATYPEDFR